MWKNDHEVFFCRSDNSRHMLQMAMRNSANIVNKWKSRVALAILFAGIPHGRPPRRHQTQSQVAGSSHKCCGHNAQGGIAIKHFTDLPVRTKLIPIILTASLFIVTLVGGARIALDINQAS